VKQQMKQRMKHTMKLAVCFMLCGMFHVSSDVSSANACADGGYVDFETMKRPCAHTPPYPPARERPEGRRAGCGACARASFMFHGSSAASMRRDARGNSR